MNKRFKVNKIVKWTGLDMIMAVFVEFLFVLIFMFMFFISELVTRVLFQSLWVMVMAVLHFIIHVILREQPKDTSKLTRTVYWEVEK